MADMAGHMDESHDGIIDAPAGDPDLDNAPPVRPFLEAVDALGPG